MEFVDALGCKQGSLPLKYLSLPLGAKSKEEIIWNTIIEKVERRLVGRKHLYKGRKVTLIKSTLSNQSTYFLSFSYPGGCCKPH